MSLLLQDPPQSDDELYLLTQAIWGVKIPRYKSDAPECADHVAPFTAFADAYFNRDSISDPGHVREGSIALWHGSRGLSGKSFALSTLGLVKPFFTGVDTNILGGSFQQSQNITTYIRKAFTRPQAPTFMIKSEGIKLISLFNGANIQPMTASQRAVRGPHPPFLILDEIDEMELEILEGALGQPMEQINYLGENLMPYTVMCSTWQNPDGTFTEMQKRAEENGWPIYRWCYRESANPIDGWLSPAHIERQKKIISKEMWRVEYELGEPSIGNRAVDSDAIEATFCLPFNLEKMLANGTAKVSKDFEEYTFEEPIRNGRYVVAADWGKEQDFTVIGVFRVPPRGKTRLAYYARMNRRPYPQMIGFFNAAVAKYRPVSKHAIHDATGLGNVVADLVDSRATGFTFSGGKRADMLSDYVAALEGCERYEFPRIPKFYTEHKYARYGDLYSNTKDYHLPDTFAMAAMANRVIRRMTRTIAISAGGEAVAKVDDPSELSRQLDFPRETYEDRDPTTRREGDVVKRDLVPTGEFNFVV